MLIKFLWLFRWIYPKRLDGNALDEVKDFALDEGRDVVVFAARLFDIQLTAERRIVFGEIERVFGRVLAQHRLLFDLVHDLLGHSLSLKQKPIG